MSMINEYISENYIPQIKCMLCDTLMSNRINGSHLKYKHNLTLDEYLLLFPNAATGSYSSKEFKCKICDASIKSLTSIKKKHLLTHGLSIHEYNKLHEIKYCKCGCNNITEYSYKRSCYNDYIDGHSLVWNKGLTKHDGYPLNGGGWNRGLTKHDDERVNTFSIKIRNAWISGAYDNMVDTYKQTMLLKYGVTNYSYTDEFKTKSKATSYKKYGTDYPMQSASVYSLSKRGRYKFKKYTWPSGKIDEVQGYEPYALNILLETYLESDLIVDKANMPEIWYTKELSDKKHRYFPDIWIPKDNTFIEVKSVYTWELDKSTFQYKRDAINNLGYKIEVWIIHNKNLKYKL